VIEGVIVHTLVVFAITLTMTKSKIMACKRQFVEDRYNHVLKFGEQPCFLHEWWRALWTCSMCCGFWVALITAHWLSPCGIIAGTLAAYGLNWIMHCIENWLYWHAKAYEVSSTGRK